MPPKLHIGTSGYAYAAWCGSFYPPQLPAEAQLRTYASHFGCVEINNSLHGPPDAATLGRWQKAVPDGFLFSLRAPTALTHTARLKEVEAPCQRFCQAIVPLAPHLGPVLVSTPSYMKVDLPRLAAFLEDFPTTVTLAVEFHHPSWFDDRVYSLLHRHNAALCITDADTDATAAQPVAPRELTADFGYVRLRRSAYSERSLRLWHAWLQTQPWERAQVVVKHSDPGQCLAAAQTLAGLVAAV
jgi:uncharacterized protein YecE (DUF72 family)